MRVWHIISSRSQECNGFLGDGFQCRQASPWERRASRTSLPHDGCGRIKRKKISSAPVIMKSTIRLCKIIVLLFAWSSLTSCSRSSVIIPAAVPTGTAAVNETIISPENMPTERADELASFGGEFAVAWVPKGEVLSIRQPAGIAGVVVEDLLFDAHGIYLTGNRSMLGSSTWLEVMTSNERIGWVNAWNLTEYVSAAEFCRDERVPNMIAEFSRIILQTQKEDLSKLASPQHGLTVRLNWYGPDIHFTRENVEEGIISSEELFWGEMANSGLSVQGSFEEIIQPKLQDVFARDPRITCNTLQYGSTAGEAIYPSEFHHINYYSFFRPASEEGNEFDWRTWVVGIEYVHGEPYIALLIHYSSEL
jgi:hypothetical protein